MKPPRLRMTAGPKGSGKSTLVEQLRTSYSVPLGYNLNPDVVERNLRETGSLDFTSWGVKVPSQKIEERYDRSISLLPEAVMNSSRAYLFDNSGEEHVLIAEFEENRLVKVTPAPPRWFLGFWQKRAE